MSELIPIIIPSYEPDSRLIELLDGLHNANIGPVVLVNDGSGESYNQYFEQAKEDYNAIVLVHNVNMGKGKALKTAFTYCLDNMPDLLGAITADSDGQHTINSIKNIEEALLKSHESLILGVRDFEGAGIPLKSQFGNIFTRKVFKSLYKKDITDTQTGLRAIPASFMRDLLDVPGDRFEFETRMLIKAVEDDVLITEVSIDTIYDSKDNHATHFRPIADSIRIYKLFGVAFGRFIISSLSSSIIDLIFFQIFCLLFKQTIDGVKYAAFASVAARIISAIYNYTLNYYYVFKSKENHTKSAFKYLVLAIVQMACSTLLTTGLIALTHTNLEFLVKIPVDVILFWISYQIQKKLVY